MTVAPRNIDFELKQGRHLLTQTNGSTAHVYKDASLNVRCESLNSNPTAHMSVYIIHAGEALLGLLLNHCSNPKDKLHVNLQSCWKTFFTKEINENHFPSEDISENYKDLHNQSDVCRIVYLLPRRHSFIYFLFLISIDNRTTELTSLL